MISILTYLTALLTAAVLSKIVCMHYVFFMRYRRFWEVIFERREITMYALNSVVYENLYILITTNVILAMRISEDILVIRKIDFL